MLYKGLPIQCPRDQPESRECRPSCPVKETEAQVTSPSHSAWKQESHTDISSNPSIVASKLTLNVLLITMPQFPYLLNGHAYHLFPQSGSEEEKRWPGKTLRGAWHKTTAPLMFLPLRNFSHPSFILSFPPACF